MAFNLNYDNVSVLVLTKNEYGNVMKMHLTYRTFVQCFKESEMLKETVLSQWYVCTIEHNGKTLRSKFNYYNQVVRFVYQIKRLRAKVATPQLQKEEQPLPAFCKVCFTECIGECDREDPVEDFAQTELGSSAQRKVEATEQVDDESWYQPYPRIDVVPQKKKRWTRNALNQMVNYGNGFARTVAGLLQQWFIKLKNRDLFKIEKELDSLQRQAHVCPNYGNAQPQMDEGPQGSLETPTQIESSNVVIESQRIPSTATTTQPSDFRSMCAATENTNFEQICNRWFSMDSLKWTTIQGRNAVVKSWILPKDPVMTYLTSISNFLPFSTFKYMSGDIDVRVELNSNKFQVGQLQFSWMYGANSDRYYEELRQNVFNASQRMHTLLSAGSSNSAEMHIPFKYVNPYLACRKLSKSYSHDMLDMGTLLCMVINPLRTPDTAYKSANLNVFIKFSNVRFVGMREIQYNLNAEPQMMGSIATGARLLSQVSGYVANVLDTNCDKPIAPNPPNVLIPTATNSFAYTDGIAEQMPTLRNLPLAQTPSLFNPKQMEVDYVASTYGLIRTEKWSADDDVGKELFNLPASPIFDKKYYNQLQKDESIVYHYPPVAYISSLYHYWRGELELRLDFVSTAFHTGKIMIVYIPGGTEKGPTDYHKLKSCPNMVYELSENRQCTMQIPYIAPKPWWPRSLSAKTPETVPPPGWIRVFILNPLIPMESVVNSVEINIYWRGVSGKFEVSIPIYPGVGLSYDATTTREDDDYCVTPYSPFFTTWYYYLNQKKLTLFYSATAGKYVQFWSMRKGEIYACNKVRIDSVDYECTIPYLKADGSQHRVTHLVRANNNWSQAVAYCFANLKSAEKYAKDGDESGAIDYYKDGDWATCNVSSASKILPNKTIRFKRIVASEQSEQVSNDSAIDVRSVSPVISPRSLRSYNAQPQIEGDVNPATQLMSSAASTAYGLATFGEQVKSLKSLGRRFSNYGEFALRAKLVTIVPIVFDRLNLDLKSVSYSDNVYRDGTLPIIFSAYRFVRGGLRFKLYFKKALPESTNVIVMFDPEFKSLDRSTTSDLVCTTANYNTIVQNTRVNEFLEFEIPYYRSGQYNLLQKPYKNEDDNLMEFFSLGALRIVTTSDTDLHAMMVYSMGDDTLVDEFIGFPPALPLQVPNAAPQMDTTLTTNNYGINFQLPKMSMVQDRVATVLENAVHDVVDGEVLPALIDVTDQLSNVTEAVAKETKTIAVTASKTMSTAAQVVDQAADRAADVIDRTADTVTNITETADDVVDKSKGIVANIASVMNTLKSSFSWIGEKFLYIKEILTHIMYAVFSPTAVVIVFATVNILALLFRNIESDFINFDSLTDFMIDLYSYYMKGAVATVFVNAVGECKRDIDELRKAGATAKPQGEGMITDFAVLAKFALKAFSLPIQQLPKALDIVVRSFNGAGKLCSSANQIGKFITDNVTCFRRLWGWAINSTCDNSEILSYLSDTKGKRTLEKFIKGVSIVTNPSNRYKVMNFPDWSTLAFRLHKMSLNLSIKFGMERETRLVSVIAPYMKKISELHDELVRHKINSPASYEPFVLYVCGEAGVGKSTIADGLCIDLLAETGVKFDGRPVFTKTPGTAYWNGLAGQPICKFDDFLQVTDPNDTSLADFFSLKSDAQFNPPQAAIEDKNVLYNPLIVVLNSNEAHPKSTKIKSETAFWRRRDMLVKMVYVPKVKGVDSMITHGAYSAQEIAEVKHAQFFISTDPTKEGDSHWGHALNIKEFKEELLTTYQMYVKKETKVYDARVKNMMRLWAKDADSANFERIMDELSLDLDTCLDDLMTTEGAEPQMDGDSKMDRFASISALTTIPEVDESADSKVEVPLVHELGSPEFDACCISQYDAGVAQVDEALGFPMLIQPKGAHDIILSGDDIGTDSVCCLHNYKDSDQAIRVYDPESHSYFLADLSIPTGICKVRRANGKLEEFEGCLFKNPAYEREYSMDTTETIAKLSYNCARIAVPPAITFEAQYPTVVTHLNRMNVVVDKAIDDAEVVEMTDEDVDFMREGDLSVKSRLVINMKRLANKLGSFLYKLYASFIKNWKVFVGACLALVFAMKLVFKLRGGPPILPEGSGAAKSYDSGSSFKSKTVKTRLTTSLQERHGISDAEWRLSWANPDSCWGEADMFTEHTQALMRKVTDNFFFIRCLRLQGVIKARCVGMRQHVAIMPWHYVEHFRTLSAMDACSFDILDSTGAVIAFPGSPFDDDNVARIKDAQGNFTGLCEIKVPSSVGMFKDITSHLLQQQDEFPSHCIFTTLVEDRFRMTREVTMLPMMTNVIQTVDPGTHSHGWNIANGFSYPKQSVGYCGSLIIAEFRSGPKIIGMHTAGTSDTGQGFAEPLMVHYFNQNAPITATTKPMKTERFVAFDVLPASNARQQLDTNVTPLFCLTRDKIPRQAKKSKLEKSLIAGVVYPIKSGPAVLSSKDPRLDPSKGDCGYVNPIYTGSRKRGMIPVLFKPDQLKKCVKHYKDMLLKTMRPRRSQVGKMTTPQAVNGIVSIQGYDKMDLTTSEGYPWVLHRPRHAKNKSYLFNIDDGTGLATGVDKDVLTRVEATNKYRESGVIPFSIYQGCLKDEKKPLEKIPIPGKTRLFELSAVDVTMCHRMYTQDFIASYISARIVTEHAVGIDTDSMEWKQLHDYLNVFSPHLLVCDYSNFGPTLQFSCIQECFEIINEWYTLHQNSDEDVLNKHNLARRCIAYEIGNAVQVCEDMVYRTHGGLPSGCTTTVYLNSMANSLYLRYAFLEIVETKKLPYTIDDFNRYIRPVTYGDDLIIAVKPEMLPHFNSVTLSKAFARYDIKLTDVSKGDEMRESCTFKDATFLKRGFRPFTHRLAGIEAVLAPLEERVVHETANWTHKKENAVDASAETVEASMLMMFGHGPVKYKNHCDKLRQAFHKRTQRVITTPDWDDMFCDKYGTINLVSAQMCTDVC